MVNDSVAESLLAATRRELLVVLDCGEESNKERKNIPAKVADCHRGRYDWTRWIMRLASELPDVGPVILVKKSSTENCLRVKVGDEHLDFALYFAQVSDDGTYIIHAKGKESEQRSGSQLALPGLEIPEAKVPDFFPFALRVEMADDLSTWFELHMVFGSRPSQTDRYSDTIQVFGRYIVKKDGPADLVPVYEVPFDPAPAA